MSTDLSSWRDWKGWLGRARDLAYPAPERTGFAGDLVGTIERPGTDWVYVRLGRLDGRVIRALNVGKLVLAAGDPVRLAPMVERSPAAWRLIGRQRPHVLYAQLIWSEGAAYSDPLRINEPWMVNVGTGVMTPIGTHRFAPLTLETTKTAQVGNWQPLSIVNGDESERYRVLDGRLSWRSRLAEASVNDGNTVYPFLQYHPNTGWERLEPNARGGNIPGYTATDNSRGEALDVRDDGTVIFVDAAPGMPDRSIKATWRRDASTGPLYVWHTFDWPGQPSPIYAALPPSTNAWIDCLDAGSPTMLSSFGVTAVNVSGVSPYINVFRSDYAVTSESDGVFGAYFHEALAANDEASYVVTWRADGGVYRLRYWFVNATGATTNRLDFATTDNNWAPVIFFGDAAPTIRTMFAASGLAPYRSSVFGRDLQSGLTGTGNFFGAVNYYGPATLAASDAITTIWHVVMTAAGATKTAVVSVVTPAGTTGILVRHATSNGKLYFTIGAGRAAYVNPHIAPGIYEMDPVTYGVRQVCGVPAGKAAGGWSAIWGDRRSVAA